MTHPEEKDSQGKDIGPIGSDDLALRIALSRVEWLKELVIKIGPRKVLVGVEYMTLTKFIDQGLEIIAINEQFKGVSDDDIPF